VGIKVPVVLESFAVIKDLGDIVQGRTPTVLGEI
jgi:hypothetical protein